MVVLGQNEHKLQIENEKLLDELNSKSEELS